MRGAAARVDWVVVGLSPVNVVDATALQRFDELREQLVAEGVTVGMARAKRQLGHAFDRDWLAARVGRTVAYPTLRSAIRAFQAAQRGRGAAPLDLRRDPDQNIS